MLIKALNTEGAHFRNIEHFQEFVISISEKAWATKDHVDVEVEMRI